MMSSENAPKKIVQSLIDLVNMTKWLMDENQQSSFTQELEILLPIIRCWGRRGESSELLRIGDGKSSAPATDTNNTSFATRSTTKRTIEEMWESKATSKKPLQSIYVLSDNLKKPPSKYVILFRVHVISQVQSSTTVVLKFSKQKTELFRTM